MVDVQRCAQCGQEFAPRVRHQRFCSTYCRIRFSRRNEGTLGWFLGGSDRPRQQLQQQLAQAYLPIVVALEELPDSPERRGAAQLAIEVIREATDEVIARLIAIVGPVDQWDRGVPPRTGPFEVEPRHPLNP